MQQVYKQSRTGKLIPRGTVVATSVSGHVFYRLTQHYQRQFGRKFEYVTPQQIKRGFYQIIDEEDDNVSPPV